MAETSAAKRQPQTMTNDEVASARAAYYDSGILIEDVPKESDCKKAVPALFDLAEILPSRTFLEHSRNIFNIPSGGQQRVIDINEAPKHLVEIRTEVADRQGERRKQVHTRPYMESVSELRRRAMSKMMMRGVEFDVSRIWDHVREGRAGPECVELR